VAAERKGDVKSSDLLHVTMKFFMYSGTTLFHHADTQSNVHTRLMTSLLRSVVVTGLLQCPLNTQIHTDNAEFSTTDSTNHTMAPLCYELFNVYTLRAFGVSNHIRYRTSRSPRMHYQSS